MAADKNYNKTLEEVVDKLNNIEHIKEIDILNIKESVESLENLMTDTQAKLNFQEIKEKLENISLQVDSCNESLLKDLFNDINQLKESTANVGEYIEKIQNVQNYALTSAEFEEYQKQQLDLALKTNENIINELNAIKENSTGDKNGENIKQIETQLETLHKNLTKYIKNITEKLENSPNIDEISAVMTEFNSVNQKNIKETNKLIKSLETKFDKFQDTEYANQLAKISEIYDSLTIIHAWIEKVGFLNKSIENVYARLGANIDFDEVSDKVDIIYENIAALNNWTMKIDNVDTSVLEIQSKIASLSDVMDEIKSITASITAIKNRFEESFSADIDFEDFSNKMDVVYENLSAINNWANKIDKISDTVNNIENNVNNSEISKTVNNIEEKVENINKTFEEEMISSKVDLIYENISLLNEWVTKVDKISKQSEELDNKFTKTNDDLSERIEKITETLSSATETISDVPDIKEKLEKISGALNSITHSEQNDDDTYIYSLLDIESDFLKLHKFLDDSSKNTTKDINYLKERFEELNDDISSISIRTNKLILSADDANKEFRTYLEAFKQTIKELDTQKKEFNPELKFNLLGIRLTELVKLMQNNINANKNINNAFIYLGEWIDATGNMLNNISEDINKIKSANPETYIKKYIDEIKQDITEEFKKEETKTEELKDQFLNALTIALNYNNDKVTEIKTEVVNSLNKIEDIQTVINTIKNDEVSELKSLMTGTIVQLNTSITPNIDGINERIDKLTEENSNKMSELETLLQTKVNEQAKQINNLENKIEDLTNKLDKLADLISEDRNNGEIKDILNYIAAQTAAANESLQNRQQENGIINDLDEKLNMVGTNVNKIVSYIEEE